MTKETEYFSYGGGYLFHIYDENAYVQERPAIILKKKDVEHYTHLLPSFYSTFSKNVFIQQKILKIPFQTREFDKRFFQLGNEFSLSVFYEMPDKKEVIGHVHDSKNKIVYDRDLIKRILYLSKIPAQITNDSSIRLKIDLLKGLKRKDTSDIVLSLDEVSESFKGDEAWNYIEAILKEYNHPCVITTHGTLRFQEQELNEEQKIMEADINAIWLNFGKKYSLGDIIKFYMKIGYSLSGFCDVFNSHFYDIKEGTGQEVIKSQKEIQEMIK